MMQIENLGLKYHNINLLRMKKKMKKKMMKQLQEERKYI